MIIKHNKLKKCIYNTNRLKPIQIYLNFKLYNKKYYFLQYKKLFYVNYFNKLIMWNLFNFIHVLNINEFLLFYLYYKNINNINIYTTPHNCITLNYVNIIYKYYYYLIILNINNLV